jgi:hypothetical protein
MTAGSSRHPVRRPSKLCATRQARSVACTDAIRTRNSSTSPRSSSSLGDWRVVDATYTIMSRTLSRAVPAASRAIAWTNPATDELTTAQKAPNESCLTCRPGPEG